MRPLMQKKFQELQELFNRGKSDLSVLLALRDELEHREAASAKQLRSQVDLMIKLLQAPSGPKAAVSNPKAPKRVAVTTPASPSTLPSTLPPASPVAVGSGRSEGEAALLRLRSTFTDEGELLARWGMTPSLPRHMQQFLITAWREELRKAPTFDGKSATDLEVDLKRLAALQHAGA